MNSSYFKQTKINQQTFQKDKAERRQNKQNEFLLIQTNKTNKQTIQEEKKEPRKENKQNQILPDTNKQTNKQAVQEDKTEQRRKQTK